MAVDYNLLMIILLSFNFHYLCNYTLIYLNPSVNMLSIASIMHLILRINAMKLYVFKSTSLVIPSPNLNYLT